MFNDSFTFITVGSTDFDALIKAVDDLAPALNIRQGAMQIGHGHYLPQHLTYFRFAPTLEPYYERAALVIAHGGLGITMEVLQRGIPLVSVSNLDRYDNHQDDLLQAMEDEGYLVWCRRLEDLESAIKTARSTTLRPYVQPECQIHEVINSFLSRR
ncbi:MAG: hypothetical protein KDJ52_15955 [Anaerolineae bacterium]|nr:hypothetical protein [Anaerolineae bacterium]